MEFKFPPIELIEASHQFPGAYTFKVIGLSDDDFRGRVISAVQIQLNTQEIPTHSHRQTAGGKHTAVTLELKLVSAKQVVEVYRCLTQIEGLVLLL